LVLTPVLLLTADDLIGEAAWSPGELRVSIVTAHLSAHRC
jgi:hypothetical protein